MGSGLLLCGPDPIAIRTVDASLSHDREMPELAGSESLIARFLLERGLAAIYVVAFLVAWRQFPALCGEHGLEPAPRFLELVPRFLDAPTVFRWIGYSDAKLRGLCAIGVAIGLALSSGSRRPRRYR